MIRRFSIATLAACLLCTLACVQQEYVGDDDPISQPDVQPPAVESSLELTYYSGHFGSYRGCPEEAFSPGRAGESDSDPVEDPPLVATDCAGEDCGGPTLNCESAQVMFMVTNAGAEDVAGVGLDDLLLLDIEGFERASLPVLNITYLRGEAFGGTIAAGQSVELRVEFRAPLNPESLVVPSENDVDGVVEGEREFEPTSGARLRIIIRAEGQDSETLDTPDIHTMPEVAT